MNGTLVLSLTHVQIGLGNIRMDWAKMIGMTPE